MPQALYIPTYKTAILYTSAVFTVVFVKSIYLFSLKIMPIAGFLFLVILVDIPHDFYGTLINSFYSGFLNIEHYALFPLLIDNGLVA